jgi:hypothetical protein
LWWRLIAWSGGFDMSNKDTGGPAFPVHPDMAAQLGCVPSSSDAGMTLRDYFAAKAMQGMMVDVEQPRCDYIAGAAYKMADAMLKAREQ